jgi:hypothetical protein
MRHLIADGRAVHSSIRTLYEWIEKVHCSVIASKGASDLAGADARSNERRASASTAPPGLDGQDRGQTLRLTAYRFKA